MVLNWRQKLNDLAEEKNPKWMDELRRKGEWKEMEDYAVELAKELWEQLTGPSGPLADDNGMVMAREHVTALVDDLIPSPALYPEP